MDPTEQEVARDCVPVVSFAPDPGAHRAWAGGRAADPLWAEASRAWD